MEGPDAERLGDADRQLVDALELFEPIEPADATAAVTPDSEDVKTAETTATPTYVYPRRVGRRTFGRRRAGRR